MDAYSVLLHYMYGIYSPHNLSSFFYVLFRVSAFVAVAPFFGDTVVPKKIKGVLVFMLSAYISPLLPIPKELELSVYTSAVISALLQQILIGLILGLICKGFFDTLRMAGQNISNAIQLAFAQMIEPGSGSQSSVIGNILNTVGKMYFLSSLGLLFLIGIFIKSFYDMPISADFLSNKSYFDIACWMGKIFSIGMMLSIPSVGVALLVNAAMAIVTRSAPSLNIFSIGFPLVIISGVIALIQIMPYLLERFLVSSDYYFQIINNIGL
ncbi:flagellar biosynthetic protein FliR [Photobacterium phosphoreum]|uniref:flagellar biosynthetic protein FliR n=1 Tax=Photobacterium phosphoreum TaxID=659 RepID=UPI0039AFB128